MNIEVRCTETSHIIDVAGEIDLYNAFQLKEAVQAPVREGTRVLILSLEKVTYIDSSGIGALLSIRAMLAQRGLPFSIVRLPEAVSRILELTRLRELLPIEETEADALETALKAPHRKNARKSLAAGAVGGDGAPATWNSVWKRVSRAIELSETLTVRTFKYLPRERIHIDRILAAFLAAADMQAMADDLSYCVHELAANAKKANAKRLYFEDKELDVLDEGDYTAGMQKFKQDVMENINGFHDRLREQGLYVKFQFRTIPNGLEVCVRNNVTFTPAEKTRIDEKLAIARRFNSLADAYTQTEDNTEGAGLGIVMMSFMLKNLGLNQDVFTIETAGKETLATLRLARPSSAPPASGTGPGGSQYEEAVR